MLDRYNRHNTQTEALISQIKKRARNLYLTRQLLCAETVLVTLNQGLDGGLSEAQAIAIAAPFSMALGESGCLCGALSGAVMACGLFLGSSRFYRHRRDTRKCARLLHDSFKAANGATCCRVLTRKVKDNKKAHLQQCAKFTTEATELAARLILDKRPELSTQAHNGFLLRRDSKIGDTMTRLFQFFSL